MDLKNWIRLSRSVVGEEEAAAIGRIIMEDGYLGMGSEVKALESDIAQFLEAAPGRVVCVSSGTAALHLAVQALTEPGDEVLVQSLTYVASFQAVTAAGAVPIPCEVDPDTLTLDIKDAEKRLTERTKAVMPVHYASNPGDLEKIYAFAQKHNLRVIEDAAHAFGCFYQGKKIGSFGDVVCFSFDGIKNITCGEGGALVTSDPDVAAKASDARLLGVENDTDKRYRGDRSWDFDVSGQGYRYHMSNIMAAIGRVQLKRLPEFAGKRRVLAALYREALGKLPDIKLLETDLTNIIPHIQPVRVLNGNRDALAAFLSSRGIQTGIHYKPNHLLTYFGKGKDRLPVTEEIFPELLSLPLHPLLTTDDVEKVIECIRTYFREQRDWKKLSSQTGA